MTINVKALYDKAYENKRIYHDIHDILIKVAGFWQLRDFQVKYYQVFV